MILSTVLRFTKCAVCAGLILVESGSTSDQSPSFGARVPRAQTKPAALQIPRLVDLPFSPAQGRREASSSADNAASSLRDVRLTGVVIEPDRRIAIFAITGTKPLVLSEGDTLKDWQVESISPEKVLLSGPAGKLTLEPRADTNLVRATSPVEVRPSQAEPGAAPVAEPGQSMAVTPIAVGNLPVGGPVPSYPYHIPEYYAGSDQYYPSSSDYA